MSNRKTEAQALTDEIMELRLDINLLSEALMKKMSLSVSSPTVRADLTTIRNARNTIQRLTRQETTQ